MELVSIAGIDENEDKFIVAKMYSSAENLVKSLGKSIDVQSMKIYVKKHRKQGNKIKYSVKIELPTSLGLVVATKTHPEYTSGKGYGDLWTIFQHSTDDIEKQARKLIEKKRDPDKRWRSRRDVKKGLLT